jgi:hypothetical protein
MQGNRLRTRQVFHRASLRGHRATLRLLRGAEDAAAAAPDPQAEAVLASLACRLAILAERTRACRHPRSAQ